VNAARSSVLDASFVAHLGASPGAISRRLQWSDACVVLSA
jgi:hypothetical protein